MTFLPEPIEPARPEGSTPAQATTQAPHYPPPAQQGYQQQSAQPYQAAPPAYRQQPTQGYQQPAPQAYQQPAPQAYQQPAPPSAYNAGADGGFVARPSRLGTDEFPARPFRAAPPVYFEPNKGGSGRGWLKLAGFLLPIVIVSLWFFHTPLMAATGIDLINRSYHGAPISYDEIPPEGFTRHTSPNGKVAFDVPEDWQDVTIELAMQMGSTQTTIGGSPVQWLAWAPVGESGLTTGSVVMEGSVNVGAVWPAALDALHAEWTKEGVKELGLDSSAITTAPEILTTGQGLSGRHSTIDLTGQGSAGALDLYTFARGDQLVVILTVEQGATDPSVTAFVDSLRIDG